MQDTKQPTKPTRAIEVVSLLLVAILALLAGISYAIGNAPAPNGLIPFLFGTAGLSGVVGLIRSMFD